MAVYKSTYCSPNSTPFDLTDVTSTNPFKLYFKVDTSNTKIIGYSVELYDVNQNKIFPVDRDNLITSVSPAWVNGENVSIDFIVGTQPTDDDVRNNTLYFGGASVFYYNFNTNNWTKIAAIANGNEYSWKVILYQTDVTQGAPAVLLDSDMILTTGTMMGSTKERIQSVPTEEVVTDYFLQPVGFDTLNYEPGQEKTWTYGGNVKQIGNRVRIKDYDPTYGYYYLQTGQYGLDFDNPKTSILSNYSLSVPAPFGNIQGKPGANYWNQQSLYVVNYKISSTTTSTMNVSVNFEENTVDQSVTMTILLSQRALPVLGATYKNKILLYTLLDYTGGEIISAISSPTNQKSGSMSTYGGRTGFWLSAEEISGENVYSGEIDSTNSYFENFEIEKPGVYNIYLNCNFLASNDDLFPGDESSSISFSQKVSNLRNYPFLHLLNPYPGTQYQINDPTPSNPYYIRARYSDTKTQQNIYRSYYTDKNVNIAFGLGALSNSSPWIFDIEFYGVLKKLLAYQIYKLSNDTSLLSAGDRVDYVIDKEVNMDWIQNASSETRSHWLQQYTVIPGNPVNQPFTSLGSGYNFQVNQGARVVFNGQTQNEYNGIFVMGGGGYSLSSLDTETGEKTFTVTARTGTNITFGDSKIISITNATYNYGYQDGSIAKSGSRNVRNLIKSASGEWSGSVGAPLPDGIFSEEVVANCTYTTSSEQTVTIEWYRAPDADTWGEIYNKVVHVSNPDSPVFYGQNIQLKQVLAEMSGGAINSTPINYIAELPIEIYPDMDTADNDLRRTTGLVFNNILDVSSTTKTMYIRPFNGIQKNMIWRQTDVNYPLNKYYKITDVNTDYWYVQYTDLYDQQSSTKLSTTPDFVIDKTKYEIRSSFLDGDIIPFNFYAKPTIDWDTYIDEAGIIVGGKFSYLQQPFLSWKQFQGFVKNGMMAPTERDPGVPIRQLSTNVFYSGNTWIQSLNYDLIYRIYQKMIKYKVSQTTINNKKLHVRTTSRITLEMAEQTTMTLNVKYASGQSGVLTMNFKDGFSTLYFYNVILDQDMMGYSCDFEFGGAAVNTIESVSSFGVNNFTLTQGNGSAAVPSSKHYIAYSLRFYGNDGGIYDSAFHALPYNSPQNKLEKSATFGFDCDQCAVKIDLPEKTGGNFYSYVFKREVGKDNPFELINRIKGGTTVPKNTFYDYSVANGHTYEYITIIANSYSANYYSYSGLITPKFDYWTLNDFEINDDGTLSIGETWKLRYNADPGAVTQNIIKTKFDNLSQYPTYSYGLTNYASGSMSCLLGREVMVATNTGACMGDWYVERLSDSSAFRNLTSNEAISMEKLWRALVHSGHKKLLRDIKGNMWVVQIVSSDVQNQDGYNGSPAMLNFDWEECDLSQEDILKMLSDTSSTASAVTTFGYVTNTTGTTQVPYLIVAASNPAITYSDVSLSQRSSPETVLNDTNVKEETPFVPPTTTV